VRAKAEWLSYSTVIVADILGSFGVKFTFFTLASDSAAFIPPEKGFAAAFLGNAALVTPEDGTLQTITFRDLTGAVESLPFNPTVKAISDSDTPDSDIASSKGESHCSHL
jgi:hypothetical protein